MKTREVQKRNGRSKNLRVLQKILESLTCYRGQQLGPKSQCENVVGADITR